MAFGQSVTLSPSRPEPLAEDPHAPQRHERASGRETLLVARVAELGQGWDDAGHRCGAQRLRSAADISSIFLGLASMSML
jgi:hypothetical protein